MAGSYYDGRVGLTLSDGTTVASPFTASLFRDGTSLDGLQGTLRCDASLPTSVLNEVSHAQAPSTLQLDDGRTVLILLQDVLSLSAVRVISTGDLP